MAKVPTHSLEAEAAVLGSILVDETSILHVLDLINEDDFFSNAHKEVYSTILDIFNEGVPIDMVLLVSRLEDKNKLTSIGGANYISRLASETVTSSHIVEYAQIIKKHSVSRRIAYLADSDADPRLLFPKLKKLEEELDIKKPTTLWEAFNKYEDEYNERKEWKGRTGIPTGIDFIDENAPIEKDTLTVLAARSSVGKSALALSIAKKAASGQYNVMFISAEMAISRLLDRLLAMMTKIDASKFRKAQTDDGMEQAKIAIEKIRNHLTFFYLPYSSSGDICRLVRKEHAKKPIDLVVVDYLQYLRDSKGKSDNEATRVGRMTRNFKALSGQCNNSVLVLSQVNRQAAMEEGGRPKLHHLRDSGAIEQDADIVLILNRIERDSKIATLDIAKNRNGDADIDTNLYFSPKTTLFSEDRLDVYEGTQTQYWQDI